MLEDENDKHIRKGKGSPLKKKEKIRDKNDKKA